MEGRRRERGKEWKGEEEEKEERNGRWKKKRKRNAMEGRKGREKEEEWKEEEEEKESALCNTQVPTDPHSQADGIFVVGEESLPLPHPSLLTFPSTNLS
ncbi:hypothetical protein SK128_021004 [Halocaridina rubra]|uniref:Uncharacterized protein n=1 Tax=Halocaridina rubra TaxID=373956 RepID=A0AAN8XKK4_HALRR